MVIRWITSPIFMESGEYNIITAMAVIFSYHNRCLAHPKQYWTRGCSTVGESHPEISMDDGRVASPFMPSKDEGRASLLFLLRTKDKLVSSSLLWTTSMDEYEVGHF